MLGVPELREIMRKLRAQEAKLGLKMLSEGKDLARMAKEAEDAYSELEEAASKWKEKCDLLAERHRHYCKLWKLATEIRHKTEAVERHIHGTTRQN